MPFLDSKLRALILGATHPHTLPLANRVRYLRGVLRVGGLYSNRRYGLRMVGSNSAVMRCAAWVENDCVASAGQEIFAQL
jgi:hypothetical protein